MQAAVGFASRRTRAASMCVISRYSLSRWGGRRDFVSRNGPRDCTRSVIQSAEIAHLKVGESHPTGRYRVSRVGGRRGQIEAGRNRRAAKRDHGGRELCSEVYARAARPRSDEVAKPVRAAVRRHFPGARK